MQFFLPKFLGNSTENPPKLGAPKNPFFERLKQEG